MTRDARPGARRGLGAVAWFPVHCTSINNTNSLISGDNKGAAAQLLEAWAAGAGSQSPGPIPMPGLVRPDAAPSFVAAFAQANVGDTSPNVLGAFCADTGAPPWRAPDLHLGPASTQGAAVQAGLCVRASAFAAPERFQPKAPRHMLSFSRLPARQDVRGTLSNRSGSLRCWRPSRLCMQRWDGVMDRKRLSCVGIVLV